MDLALYIDLAPYIYANHQSGLSITPAPRLARQTAMQAQWSKCGSLGFSVTAIFLWAVEPCRHPLLGRLLATRTGMLQVRMPACCSGGDPAPLIFLHLNTYMMTFMVA